jgi:hypothetical protein
LSTLLLLLLPQLRFNKVAELIHNSTNHRNLERACVTVFFQEIVDKVSNTGSSSSSGSSGSSSTELRQTTTSSW